MDLKRKLGLGSDSRQSYELIRSTQSLVDRLNLDTEDADSKIGSEDSRGLSGGQRKRVSVGLELLADPAVLLVDEATSGLDAKMAGDVIAILRRL